MKKEKKKSGRPRSLNAKRVQFSLTQQAIADLKSLSERGCRSHSQEIRRLIAQEKAKVG